MAFIVKSRTVWALVITELCLQQFPGSASTVRRYLHCMPQAPDRDLLKLILFTALSLHTKTFVWRG